MEHANIVEPQAALTVAADLQAIGQKTLKKEIVDMTPWNSHLTVATAGCLLILALD